jgi:hypothetical protein
MSDMIEAPEAQTDITALPPADRAALVLNSTKTEAARVLAELQAEMLAHLDRMKAQLVEELDRQAAELEARKAEAEKPAQVLADDPREALGQIMPSGLAAYAAFAAALAAPVIDAPVIDAPAPLDETPCAEDLAQTIADIRDVPLATAIRWFAERADEFKTLHAESTK